MAKFAPLTAILNRFWRKEDGGTSTVEFTILFPAFILVLLCSVESGILMIRSVMMERSLDMAVRTLRLGIDAPEDEDELLTMVCDEAQMIPDCENSVRIELTRVSTGDWVMPSEFATCVQRGEDLQPLLTYEAGGDHDIMIVRACAVVDPWFPSTGLGLRLPKDSSGGYNIIASSAFVNEPSS